jgi:hypothetical protein
MTDTAVASNGSTEPAHLLDANVLVALLSDSHIHHEIAARWFPSTGSPFATCPITQGTLLRLLMNVGGPDGSAARSVPRALGDHPRHRFWPDDLSCADIRWHGGVGQRQVDLPPASRRHCAALGRPMTRAAAISRAESPWRMRIRACR